MDLGVQVINNDKEIIENADIIIQLGLPNEDRISLLKSNQILIVFLIPHYNKHKL